jgi:hypothetical protein
MEKSVLEKIEDPHVENRYNMTSSNHLFPAPSHNGRVPNVMDREGNTYASAHYRSKPSAPNVFEISMRNDLIGHIHTATPLNQIFFSDSNLDKIQKDIQNQVNMMSGGKYTIDRQSDIELKLIMRSYYLTYAKNNASQVAEELADLNSRVVGYAAGKIYSEVDFHMFYIVNILINMCG